MSHWNAADEISAQELKLRLEKGDRLVLLDVRQKWETDICRIAGSMHIPAGEIDRRLGEISPESEIVVYCHHGVRSAAAARHLRQRGFGRVWNLAGGIASWAKAIDLAMPQY